MKILLLTISLSLIGVVSKAQSSPAQILANMIAQRMKDSLSLNETQKAQIYDINMQLHNEKMSVRQMYANHAEITLHLQNVENKRDSLYNHVLSSEKYSLYLQKKRNLIKNN